jgi:hypothetical protein
MGMDIKLATIDDVQTMSTKKWFDNRETYQIANTFDELISKGQGFWKFSLKKSALSKIDDPEAAVFGMYKTSKYFVTKELKNTNNYEYIEENDKKSKRSTNSYVWTGEDCDNDADARKENVKLFYGNSKKQNSEEEWSKNMMIGNKNYTRSGLIKNLKDEGFWIEFYVYKTEGNVVFGPSVRVTGSGVFPIITEDKKYLLREIADFENNKLTYRQNKNVGDKYFLTKFTEFNKYHNVTYAGEVPKAKYDSGRENNLKGTICNELYEELGPIIEYLTLVADGAIGQNKISSGSSLPGALAKYHGYAATFILSADGRKKFEKIPMGIDDKNNLKFIEYIVTRDLGADGIKYKVFMLIPMDVDTKKLTQDLDVNISNLRVSVQEWIDRMKDQANEEHKEYKKQRKSVLANNKDVQKLFEALEPLE